MELVRKSTDPEVVSMLGKTVETQNGVIAKCIKRIDADEIYQKELERSIK